MTKNGGYKPNYGYLDRTPRKETSDDRYVALLKFLEEFANDTLMNHDGTSPIQLQLIITYLEKVPGRAKRALRTHQNVGAPEVLLARLRNSSIVNPETQKPYTIHKTSSRALIAFEVRERETNMVLIKKSKAEKK